MPASMGLMTLGRLIMYLAGEFDTWDPRGLMMGMMGGGMGGGWAAAWAAAWAG